MERFARGAGGRLLQVQWRLQWLSSKPVHTTQSYQTAIAIPILIRGGSAFMVAIMVAGKGKNAYCLWLLALDILDRLPIVAATNTHGRETGRPSTWGQRALLIRL